MQKLILAGMAVLLWCAIPNVQAARSGRHTAHLTSSHRATPHRPPPHRTTPHVHHASHTTHKSTVRKTNVSSKRKTTPVHGTQRVAVRRQTPIARPARAYPRSMSTFNRNVALFSQRHYVYHYRGNLYTQNGYGRYYRNRHQRRYYTRYGYRPYRTVHRQGWIRGVVVSTQRGTNNMRNGSFTIRVRRSQYARRLGGQINGRTARLGRFGNAGNRTVNLRTFRVGQITRFLPGRTSFASLRKGEHVMVMPAGNNSRRNYSSRNNSHLARIVQITSHRPNRVTRLN